MSYAFTFDASACTGCKTCQVACKDKNGLPAGVLWRRVYEVSGGSWQRQGAAWTNTVFAYNVSMACNHCADPACAHACPTGACTVRGDGIVWIDSEKCAGCEYCGWACPYGAPQYSGELGRMTKCDFCRDLIDEGLSPVCVTACPMRALDFIEVASAAWDAPVPAQPYPLPASSRTQPRIIVKPHAAMQNALPKEVANREEVRPRLARREMPLVLFTLLGQAAAGAAVMTLFAGPVSVRLLATIGVLTVLATLASLLHLANVSQAWRAPSNAKTSALSREVVVLGLFAGAWVLTWLSPEAGRVPLAVGGLALIYAMAEVYVLEAIPGWTRTRVRVAFTSSALLLGTVAVLATFGPVPVWVIAIVASGILADQVVRRWRFYDARTGKVM